MRTPAIVLANDSYRTANGKPAHGLVRGSNRFDIQSVIDPECAGKDAGTLLDGKARDIPVVKDIDEALARARTPPQACIVGIATHGGRLTETLRAQLLEAAGCGLSLVSGLHDFIGEDPEISAAARAAAVDVVDVRKPPPRAQLSFWEGGVAQIRAIRIAVLGTDCAVGKRTTARMLVSALNAAGIRSEMIYTGQTGWMQGARYGFVLDSTPNDYVSGELEQALLRCAQSSDPDVMVIEGQSALRNPSGPCGAELLLSGDVSGVVLQHAPGRTFFDGFEHLGRRIPSLRSEIELVSLYGVATLAVTLNGDGLDRQALAERQAAYAEELGIPVIAPLHDNMDSLVGVMRALTGRAT